MAKVFISHSTQDRAFVEQEILGLLNQHGIETWYSKDDIQSADRWERTILQGLEACDWFLLVMSSRSAQSEWVKDEVNWAIDYRPGRIVPVLMEACDTRQFHIRMARLQHIDFPADREQAKVRLLQTWGIRVDQAQRVQALREQAELLAKEGDWVKAIERYDEAIRLNPHMAENYLERGDCHLAGGAWEPATADYTRAIELKPRDPRAYYQRATAHRQRGDPESARSDYSKILALNPNDILALTNRGACYSLKRAYDEAFADFAAALRLDPRNDRTLVSRGDAYFAKGEHTRALADYHQALEINPRSAMAHQKLGDYFHLHKKDFEQAIKHYTEAVRIDPKNENAFFNRGLAHAAKGDNDSATADMSRVLEINPARTAAYLQRGMARAKQYFKQTEAKADFDEALRLQPNFVPALLQRAQLAIETKDFDAARADLDAAVAAQPRSSTGYLQRANFLFFQLGDKEQSLADYEKYTAIAPNEAGGWHGKALVFMRQGKTSEAITCLDRAVQLSAANANLWELRSEAHLRSGHFEQAQQDVDEAIRLEPTAARLYKARGDLHLAQSRWGEAIASYSRALYHQEDFPAAQCNRARGHAKAGAHEPALADFHQAIRKEPKFSNVWRNDRLACYAALGIADADSLPERIARAQTYLERGSNDALFGGHHDWAHESYTRAIELDPWYAKAYLERAEANRQMNKPEAEQQDIEHFLRLSPRDLRYLLKQAEAMRAVDHARALELAEQALNIDPACAAAHFVKGDVLRPMGRFEESHRALDEAVRLDPTNNVYRASRGVTASDMKRYDEALVELDEVMRRNPSYTWALQNRADTHFKMGKYDLAEADCSALLGKEPSNAVGFGIRGACRRMANRLPEALDDLNHAITLSPEYSFARFHRGETLRLLSKPEEALLDLAEAIRLFPNYTWAHWSKGQIHQRQGEHELAERHYRAALDSDANNAFHYNQLAWTYASCKDDRFRKGSEALELALKACELSNWHDFNNIDTLAAAYALVGDFEKAVRYQKQCLDEHPEIYPGDDLSKARRRLELFEKGQAYREE